MYVCMYNVAFILRRLRSVQGCGQQKATQKHLANEVVCNSFLDGSNSGDYSGLLDQQRKTPLRQF